MSGPAPARTRHDRGPVLCMGQGWLVDAPVDATGTRPCGGCPVRRDRRGRGVVMAELTLYDVDPAFSVERHESGEVELLIRAGDTAVRINVGREYDRVSALADNLAEVGAEVERDILDGWQDVPDEGDGYVSFHRGRYHVRLD